MVPSGSEHDDLVRRVEDDVAALGHAVERERPELLPLDRSYASLDRVEEYYRSALDAGPTSDALDARVASYLGATLAASTGARWEPPQKPADRDRPGIARLPKLPRARFDPLAVVRTYKRIRSPGYLRDSAERYDVPARRAHLARLLANGEGTLARLRTDVRELLGRDPGSLDGSRDSVTAVEAALKRMVASGVPVELERRVKDAATFYLGQIAQRAVGGEWSISENPKDADLGQLQINGWSPMSVIRNVGPESDPGLLQTVLAAAIESRSRR